ncbi:MAG: succinylglutamate-semialdehyde dehydrogenase [Pseudomonadales bacterium]|nr:succinylglutamate-semialdehyde dehydrogenase [Pseudomonadales bacterium]
MESRQQHYIDGQWVGGGSHVFDSVSPIDGATLWSGKAATTEQAFQAVGAARLAFESWSELSFEQRQVYITRFVELVEANKDLLAETIHSETGKPLWESKTEIGTMVAKAAVSAKAYEERTGQKESEANGVHLALSHKAIGVFVVLGPYNFPGHLPNGHIIPALLAGNTIIFKPSELTPLFGELMVQCWEQAGLPKGVLNLLQGEADTGRLLANVDGIDGLLFTGSSRTGQAIHKAFGGQPNKMLALEMGGNNPLVVDHVADIPAAVYTILQSAFISAGQRCTCARRLILVRSEENEALVEALVAATEKLKVGFDDDCFMGPVVSNRAADQVMAFSAELLANGGKILKLSERPFQDKPLVLPGIVDVTDINNKNDEECFGPLLQVEWVDSLEEGIRIANATQYGLSAGLLSDSNRAWELFSRKIRAGIVNRNRPLTGASGAAPFGGVGASGNYRPGAYYAADYCAYPMASMSSDQVELPDSLAPGIEL